MKFQQRKIWPTRRIHLFQRGQEISFCGLAWRVDGEDHAHPYDDLNYCQCCRRKAMGYHGQKYLPMTEKYDHLRKAYEKAKGKVKK